MLEGFSHRVGTFHFLYGEVTVALIKEEANQWFTVVEIRLQAKACFEASRINKDHVNASGTNVAHPYTIPKL